MVQKREREKLEGEGGESRRNIWTKSPEQSIRPPGQGPCQVERSEHKVTAAFPLGSSCDLVFAIRDQKTAKFAKNPLFLWAHKEISGSGVFANFNGPGLVFGQSKFPEHHHPYGNGKSL